MHFLDQVCTAHHGLDEAQGTLMNEDCFRARSAFSDIETSMRRQHVHHQIASAASYTSG